MNPKSALPPAIFTTSFQKVSSTTISRSATSLQAIISPIAPLSFAGILLLRGGAKEAAINLGKEAMKIQAMATYSTITALIMNAALRLYTSQSFDIKVTAEGDQSPPVVAKSLLESIFTASTILCIVSGVFTAVLFNVLGIYSKEALGMDNVAGYISFRDATAVLRKWGFRAFLVSMCTFVTSFLISVAEKTSYKDRWGQLILVGSILLTLVGAFHIHTVLTLATKYIYTARAVAENGIA